MINTLIQTTDLYRVISIKQVSIGVPEMHHSNLDMFALAYLTYYLSETVLIEARISSLLTLKFAHSTLT